MNLKRFTIGLLLCALFAIPSFSCSDSEDDDGGEVDLVDKIMNGDTLDTCSTYWSASGLTFSFTIARDGTFTNGTEGTWTEQNSSTILLSQGSYLQIKVDSGSFSDGTFIGTLVRSDGWAYEDVTFSLFSGTL